MENKIVVKNLKKNFGKLEVLKDISVEIAEGEVQTRKLSGAWRNQSAS